MYRNQSRGVLPQRGIDPLHVRPEEFILKIIAYDVMSGLLRGLDYSVQRQWDIAIVTFPEDASAIAQRYFLFKRRSEKLK